MLVGAVVCATVVFMVTVFSPAGGGVLKSASFTDDDHTLLFPRPAAATQKPRRTAVYAMRMIQFKNEKASTAVLSLHPLPKMSLTSGRGLEQIMSTLSLFIMWAV